MKKIIKERRIEVLKDALLQIKAKKYKITQGTYVLLSPTLQSLKNEITKDTFYWETPKEDVSAQECLLTDKKACKVCAKGAIFLSIVRKENKVMLSELNDHDIREEKTEKLFGKKNLDLMEAAFEKWMYITNEKDNPYSSYKTDIWTGDYRFKDVSIEKFVKKHPKKDDRLIAILKNSIKNDGIFKP